MTGSNLPRRLSHDIPPNPAETLRTLAEYAGDVPPDKYMTGELFDRLHEKVAKLLGKEAALYLPSGKLAQMAALKVLCGKAGCNRVAMHPRSHLEEHEKRAYQELWGLTAAHLGGYDCLPTHHDLRSLHEPLGVVTVELPIRRLGCLLPNWDELSELCHVAKRKGAFLHMDGARLWESQPFYNKTYAEIAALFDTIYVAMDKGLGGLAGAVLAGPQWVIDEVEVWQRRAGGRALRSFPHILSALKALEDRLPRMKEFHNTAKQLARSLDALDGVQISPKIPHTNAFLVSFIGDSEKAIAARNSVADELGIWLFDAQVDCVDQSVVRFELTVRGAAYDIEIGEILHAIQYFRDLVLHD
ncbi:MAG: beta-eliminating lyase-related protein [Hyphomicrobiales bacterium]